MSTTFDGQPLTRRETLIARGAFHRGIDELYGQDEIPDDAATWAAFRRAQGKACHLYPLPKIVRPRVVNDPAGHTTMYRVVGGQLQHRFSVTDGWKNSVERDLRLVYNPERIRVLADLLANPTEEVEDPGE